MPRKSFMWKLLGDNGLDPVGYSFFWPDLLQRVIIEKMKQGRKALHLLEK